MQTLQDLVKSFSNYGNRTAISFRQDENIKRITYSELYNKIDCLARGFLSLGLANGDRIALISGNNPKWLETSLAINYAGLVDVPRGEQTSEQELAYILDHSESKIAIVEDESVLSRIKPENHSSIMGIFSIENVSEIPNTSKLEEIGKGYRASIPEVRSRDLASIIYTSGTTGVPKGVELTHENFASNIESTLKIIGVTPDDKFLSILPAWHVFERIMKYISSASGAETFHTNQRRLLSDLVEQNPTIVASVPRIWQMFYNGVMKKAEEDKTLKGSMLRFSLDNAVKYSESKGRLSIDKLRWPLHVLMDAVVLSKIREKLGTKFKYAISGGGALQKHVDTFFDAIGIEILEGYGLTETSPVVSVRRPGSRSLRNVGKLISGVEAKIIDKESGEKIPDDKEGIICVMGPNVMKGYHKNLKETARVLSADGWFNTGDRGYFTKKKELVITGREKEIIVLSNGENINPVPIESALMQSKYIDTAILTGQDWRLLGVYIVPNFDALEKYCETENIFLQKNSLETALSDEKITRLFKNEINALVSKKYGFQNYELVHAFSLLPNPFIPGKELTHTLKPRRAEIDRIYAVEHQRMREAIER